MKTFTGKNAAKEMARQMEKDIRHALINTVNLQAGGARKIIQTKTLPDALTLRNNFAKNSIVYTQCKKNVTNINDIKSEVGAQERAGFLVIQETGGTRKPSADKKKLPIYTDAARIGKSRSRLVRKDFSKGNVFKNLADSPSNLPTRKRRAIRMYNAYKQKIFAGFKNTIFRVTKAKKDSDTGRIHFETEQILNLKYHSVQLKQREWLRPAINHMSELGQTIFEQQMDKITR